MPVNGATYMKLTQTLSACLTTAVTLGSLLLAPVASAAPKKYCRNRHQRVSP
jgi:hypothetical protein